MTENPTGQYQFENTNPNTFLHSVIYCPRCKKTMGLIQTHDVRHLGEVLCYPCYKELLKKN